MRILSCDNIFRRQRIFIFASSHCGATRESKAGELGIMSKHALTAANWNYQ